jgi:hypothetical protein
VTSHATLAPRGSSRRCSPDVACVSSRIEPNLQWAAMSLVGLEPNQTGSGVTQLTTFLNS